MKRVTGIGGMFFKSKNSEQLKAWYQRHLGIASDQHGASFKWRDEHDPSVRCITAWSVFPDSSKYFDPSQQSFMINYRVENLEALLEELRKEGVQIVGEIEKYEYGKFGWIVDPDGNKIELWEAVDEKLIQ